jgi:hypothetical protein
MKRLYNWFWDWNPFWAWVSRHPALFGAALGLVQGVTIGWMVLDATKACR